MYIAPLTRPYIESAWGRILQVEWRLRLFNLFPLAFMTTCGRAAQENSEIIIAASESSIKNDLKLEGTGWNSSIHHHDKHTTCHSGDSFFLSWYGEPIQCVGSPQFQSTQVERRKDEQANNPEIKAGRNQSCLLRFSNHLTSTWHTLKRVNQEQVLQNYPSRTTCLTITQNSVSKSHSNSNFLIQSIPKSRIKRQKREESPASNSSWSLEQRGHTGVSTTMLTVVTDKYALMLDRVEDNPLRKNGFPVWGALYDLDTDQVKPLELQSNSFCAGGSFLGNGTQINFGGTAPAKAKPVSNTTRVFGPGNQDGLQSIRFYTPCDDGECTMTEYPTIKLNSKRWYATAARLPDGSIMIVGGCTSSTFRNNATINNPTLEFFPPKKNLGSNSESEVFLSLLNRTMISNLFPIVLTLPIPNTVFIAANDEAILYNWKTNKETQLPRLPNGVRISYPYTGSGLLLPLSYKHRYTPKVLICGGTTLDDQLPVEKLSVKLPASSQCFRITLTECGISKGWQVEEMLSPRIMPDMVMMPTGQVLIVNGGKTGIAGFGDKVSDAVGRSYADTPNLTPVLYNPTKPVKKRFSTDGMPTSQIARLYHSVASLTPSGKVMIAGSNPNSKVSTTKYQTEYRAEWLSPPYIHDPTRPVIKSLPSIANYNESITVTLNPTKLVVENSTVEAILLDLGFVTHSVPMNSRLVYLKTTVDPATGEVKATIPPAPEIYPPGYAWLHVLVNGVPSPGRRLMIGSGKLTI